MVILTPPAAHRSRGRTVYPRTPPAAPIQSSCRPPPYDLDLPPKKYSTNSLPPKRAPFFGGIFPQSRPPRGHPIFTNKPAGSHSQKFVVSNVEKQPSQKSVPVAPPSEAGNWAQPSQKSVPVDLSPASLPVLGDHVQRGPPARLPKEEQPEHCREQAEDIALVGRVISAVLARRALRTIVDRMTESQEINIRASLALRKEEEEFAVTGAGGSAASLSELRMRLQRKRADLAEHETRRKRYRAQSLFDSRFFRVVKDRVTRDEITLLRAKSVHIKKHGAVSVALSDADFLEGTAVDGATEKGATILKPEVAQLGEQVEEPSRVLPGGGATGATEAGAHARRLRLAPALLPTDEALRQLRERIAELEGVLEQGELQGSARRTAGADVVGVDDRMILSVFRASQEHDHVLLMLTDVGKMISAPHFG